MMLALETRDGEANSRPQRTDLPRQVTLLSQHQDRLLNMRISPDTDQEVFIKRQTQLRDRLASIRLHKTCCTAPTTKRQVGGESG